MKNSKLIGKILIIAGIIIALIFIIIGVINGINEINNYNDVVKALGEDLVHKYVYDSAFGAFSSAFLEVGLYGLIGLIPIIAGVIVNKKGNK